MTFTVFGVTISVTRTQPADQFINWYPGAEKHQPVDFYEQTKVEASKLWTLR